MPVVDIRTVKLNNSTQLLQQRLTRCFNTKDRHHFATVVRVCARRINILLTHHRLQVRSTRLQIPLHLRSERAVALDECLLLLHHVHTCNVLDSTKTDRVQQTVLNLLQEHILLFLYIPLLVCWVFTDDSASDNQLLGIVVRTDAHQVALKVLRDLVRHICHRQLLVQHHLAVQLNTQQPRRRPRHIQFLVWHRIVCCHKVLILLNVRVLRIGIIVNLCR
jgi:hypothetical protein